MFSAFVSVFGLYSGSGFVWDVQRGMGYQDSFLGFCYGPDMQIGCYFCYAQQMKNGQQHTQGN